MVNHLETFLFGASRRRAAIWACVAGLLGVALPLYSRVAGPTFGLAFLFAAVLAIGTGVAICLQAVRNGSTLLGLLLPAAPLLGARSMIADPLANGWSLGAMLFGLGVVIHLVAAELAHASLRSTPPRAWPDRIVPVGTLALAAVVYVLPVSGVV